MTYLSRWRLQLGARLLRTTSFSVAWISGEVGYESEPSFNRAFKREFGVPPARFRLRARSNRQAPAAKKRSTGANLPRAIPRVAPLAV